MKNVLHVMASVMMLTIAVTASAQKGLSLSVKGIPQFAWSHNSDDKDISGYKGKSKFRAAFGVGAEYGLTKNIGLGLDVLFSLQGKKYDLNKVPYDLINDYVKIPVYLIYNSGSKSKIAFVGKLGPQFGILSRSRLKGNNKDIDTKDLYKNFNVGVATNAGIQLELSKNFFLDGGLRFDYDFTNAEDEQFSTNRGRASSHNSTLGLEIGMKFRVL